jgi:hypothetical protein
MDWADDTLASVEYSPLLFANACAGASVVLPWLHGTKKLAYGDPSPDNVLVVGGKVLWNDFADVFPLGRTPVAFRTTIAYASTRMTPILIRTSNESLPYDAIDDAQAIFFTLLSFAHLKRRLPWAGQPVAVLCAQKLAWVSQQQESLKLSVQEFSKAPMEALFTAVFVEKCPEHAWKVLGEVFASQDDGKESVATVREATTLFHQEQCEHTTNAGEVMTRCESTLQPCTRCFPQGDPICQCASCGEQRL